MFNFFKSLAIAVFFFTLAIVSYTFAQDTTHTGVLESVFFEQCAKNPLMSNLAVLIYSLFVGFSYRGIQEILKKVPTSWGPNGPKAIWTIAALIFGKSILFYNAKPDVTLNGTQKMIAEQRLLEDLQKHIENHGVKTE